mmetsp:Transcript_6099/g.18402  ORF Transcript_6099/g.18402 Transcript_6099/m.18402 type:complete len:91 (-) Transcript_6099:643-915(-)
MRQLRRLSRVRGNSARRVRAPPGLYALVHFHRTAWPQAECGRRSRGVVEGAPPPRRHRSQAKGKALDDRGSPGETDASRRGPPQPDGGRR